MNLAAVFIKRPITTTLIMLGIMVFGVMSYRLLPVSDLPAIDFPTISVQATLDRRQPRNHRVCCGAAARKAVLDDLRSQLDQLDQHAGQHQHHAAVRLEPGHRCRRPGRPVDDREGRAPAAVADYSAVVPESQSGRFSRPASQPRSATLPLSTVNEYAESTISQRISTVTGVAQVQVFAAQNTPCASTWTRDDCRPSGIGIDEVVTAIQRRERQSADRHNIRREELHGSCRRSTVQGRGVRPADHRIP